MKLIITLLATLLLACTATETITGNDKGTKEETNLIQYVILGDAGFVSIAFYSEMGSRDSVICAVMPWFVEMELPVGETAYMRVHKQDINDVVTVGIVQNGFFNAIDTATQGDDMAEVECLVWR